MLRPLVIALLAVATVATVAHADFYQWTDRDGRQFYTNEIEKVPAEYRDSAKRVEVDDARVSVDRKASGGAAAAAREPEHKDRNGKGESYWRKRAENLRRQIREQQDEYDLLVKQERAAQERPKKASAKSGKKKSARVKKMEKIEKKIAALRRELDEKLPEEARKADAYPGWVRE